MMSFVKDSKIIAQCELCGDSYGVGVAHQRFCSKYCRGKARRNKYPGRLRLRFLALQKNNFSCFYCGRNPSKHGISLHIDHVVPKSKGGQDTLDNLVAACSDCNLGKKDLLLN